MVIDDMHGNHLLVQHDLPVTREFLPKLIMDNRRVEMGVVSDDDDDDDDDDDRDDMSVALEEGRSLTLLQRIFLLRQ